MPLGFLSKFENVITVKDVASHGVPDPPR